MARDRGETERMVLDDLHAGPKGIDDLRGRYGGYAYPLIYRLSAKGYVEYDASSKSFVLTELGERRRETLTGLVA